MSPLIVVHGMKEPRLCVDMHRVNEAIERKRYPIPIIDEILKDMTGATFFEVRSQVGISSSRAGARLQAAHHIRQTYRAVAI